MTKNANDQTKQDSKPDESWNPLKPTGWIIILFFMSLFGRDIYQSERVQHIKLPGGYLSPEIYDPKFCKETKDYLIQSAYELSRIKLWFNKIEYRSIAYKHAKSFEAAIKAAEEFQLAGDFAAANQALQDAKVRLDMALEHYQKSTCFDAEAKRRTY